MEKLIEKIRKAEQKPGIYAFKNKKGEFLYIGKAGNLRNRLKQYMNKAQSPFMSHMLNEAEKIETKITDSEIEALILESKLKKKKKPKYNVMLRDDKQYFYVGFTNDEFEKVFITHQPSNIDIGPFTDGNALKSTLRLLRKVFPYCTCKQKHNNFCLNYHIGKCLGFCCLKNPKIGKEKIEKYRMNIKVIKDTLNGKKNTIVKKLKQELQKLGGKQKFEEAIELKTKIEKLEKIFENAKIIQNVKYETQDKKSVLEKLSKVFKLPHAPYRIEGYDISNIQGKNAVGSMVVFTNGRPDPEGVRQSGPYGASKNEYRKFKIFIKKTPDDIAMLKEILVRRFNHPEWPRPDLIFIDGGIAQLNAAKAIIHNSGFKIPVISLAKGRNEVFSTTLKEPIPMKKLSTEIQNLIKHIDSEAHRFAIAYYRKRHRKFLLK